MKYYLLFLGMLLLVLSAIFYYKPGRDMAIISYGEPGDSRFDYSAELDEMERIYGQYKNNFYEIIEKASEEENKNVPQRFPEVQGRQPLAFVVRDENIFARISYLVEVNRSLICRFSFVRDIDEAKRNQECSRSCNVTRERQLDKHVVVSCFSAVP